MGNALSPFVKHDIIAKSQHKKDENITKGSLRFGLEEPDMGLCPSKESETVSKAIQQSGSKPRVQIVFLRTSKNNKKHLGTTIEPY